MAQTSTDLIANELKFFRESMTKFEASKTETEIKQFLTTNSIVTNFISQLDVNEDNEPAEQVYKNVKVFRSRVPYFVSTASNETKISMNKWTDLAVDMPSALKHVKPSSDPNNKDYENMVKSVVASFYPFLKACYDEIEKMGLKSQLKYSIKWQGATKGRKEGTYRQLLGNLVACALATIRVATQKKAQLISRTSLDWPGPIISLKAEQQDLVSDDKIYATNAKIDHALSYSKSDDPTQRQLGLEKAKKLVEEQWSAHILNTISAVTSDKFEDDNSDTINKKVTDKAKKLFIDDCLDIFLEELFNKNLLERDDQALGAKLEELNEYIIIAKTNNKIDSKLLDPIKYTIEQLLNFARNSKKQISKLTEAFKSINLENAQTEYVIDSARVSHPPQIDLHTRNMFEPEQWRKTKPLADYIYDDYLHYCAKARVVSNADKVRGLYYCFESRRLRTDFDREVLRNIPEGRDMTKDEVDSWMKKICRVFDVESAKTTQHYLQLFYDSKTMCQKRTVGVLIWIIRTPRDRFLNDYLLRCPLSAKISHTLKTISHFCYISV